MAERRMFAKTIVLSDAFLDMPMSARCLYFTWGMLADDDGFVNSPKAIMRQCGASDDDMRVLLAKKFVLAFDTGIIVIKHWRINNYLRSDRYMETKYVDEKNQLEVDTNGAYTRISEEPQMLLTANEMRQNAMEDSDLPYSFTYKMRQAFHGKPCPVCGCEMLNVEHGAHRPTIQHNTPISKGGKHELSNISVICHACNVSIRDTPTGSLNNEDVVRVWNEISGNSDSGIPSMVYPDKDRLGKDRLGNKYTAQNPPTLDEVRAYCNERQNGVNAEKWYAHYEANGWKVGRTPMKNWKAAVRTWEKGKAEYEEF